MQLFQNVSSISFGSKEGEVTWLYRLEETSLQLGICDNLTAGNIEVYALEPPGKYNYTKARKL